MKKGLREAMTNGSKIVDFYPASSIGKILWRWVWGPITLFAAFVPLAVIHLLQYLTLLVLPFSRRLFRRLNRLAGAGVWGWWAWSLQNIIGFKLIVTGDSVRPEENAIVFCNHQAMSDIPMILCLALDKGRIGDLKWVAKDALKYVPGLGWGMLFLECIFIKRNWARDKEKFVAAMSKFKKFKIPVWVVLFPEGTRLKPYKLEESIEYATKTGKQVLNHLLLPRTKGFSAVWSGLQEHLDAVYSVTIAYENKVPSLAALLRGDVRQAHCHIRRIPVEQIPPDSRGAGKWMTQEFLVKDRVLNHFAEHKVFPQDANVPVQDG
jgi:lysocardiolipin and lysophospholipid acyltransferase